MKKKTFQYLIILLLGTTAAFADWSESLKASIKNELVHCTEDQAVFGKDSIEEDPLTFSILKAKDNPDTGYPKMVDFIWNTAEVMSYALTYGSLYGFLGEDLSKDLAQKLLMFIQDNETPYTKYGMAVTLGMILMQRDINSLGNEELDREKIKTLIYVFLLFAYTTLSTNIVIESLAEICNPN